MRAALVAIAVVFSAGSAAALEADGALRERLLVEYLNVLYRA